MLRKTENKGITLIALVVSIIVLLILAGISISMLTGENGLLTKARDAKGNTERAEIVENARLDVLTEITDNKGNDITENQFKKILKKYFINNEIPEELPEDLSTLELTTLKNENYKIKISEIYDGKVKKILPGLYYAGTDNLYMSWEDLIKPENKMLIVNGTALSRSEFSIEDSVKLVISSDITSIANGGLAGLQQLEEIIIPNSVISIGNQAFNGTGLKSVSISNDVTNFGSSIFGGCTKLETAKIDAKGTIDNSLFAGCNSLKTLYLGEDLILPTSGVTFVPQCSCLENVTILASGKIAGGCFAQSSNLTTINLGNKITEIMNQAFENCIKMTDIEIPSSVTTIGQNAFTGSGLTSITTPNSVTSIGDGAFNGCTKLINAYIMSGNTGYGLFNNCPKLETVKFGEGVSTVQNGAFYQCPKLEKIIIEKGSELTVPDNKWGTTNVEIIKEE